MSSRTSFTVETNGQALIVNIAGSGAQATPVLYSDAATTAAVTLPHTITANTTYYLKNEDGGSFTVSVKQLDGTELWGRSEQIRAGSPVSIDPLPSVAQLAADSTVSLATEPTGTVGRSLPRMGTTFANISALTSGTMMLTAVELSAGAVVSNLTYHSATTAAGTPTNYWFALYTSARELCGQTADQTSSAWAANTSKTLALTTPYTVPRPGLYYAAIMVAASSVPSLFGIASSTFPHVPAPITNGNSSTSLTTTAPATAGALSGVGNVPWVYLT